MRLVMAGGGSFFLDAASILASRFELDSLGSSVIQAPYFLGLEPFLLVLVPLPFPLPAWFFEIGEVFAGVGNGFPCFFSLMHYRTRAAPKKAAARRKQRPPAAIHRIAATRSFSRVSIRLELT